MIDIVMRISALPESGSDALASERLLTTGGGYNALSAAARQDMPCVYAGRLGTGPFSSLASGSLDGDDIAHPIESNEDLDAGFCVVLVDDEGERTFITSPGAEASLRASDLERLDVVAGDYVLVSGYNVMYADLAEVVLEWLMRLPDGVVVGFDPSNRVMDIPKGNLNAMLARADWLMCNETEASLLTGEGTSEDAVSMLGSMTGRIGAIVRTGANGCTLQLRGGAQCRIKAFKTAVVDTNGAGDTHNGVFLAELALGADPTDAALRANAAAAIAISELGPATSPTRATITRWMGR
jgi:sugar/nucleoside kinase (ribokinase family)